jgi:hypothetical protein
MARRFKINPEKYGKIKERNYRGNDWNTDSGNHDCPSRRKKKTVLDEDEKYTKSTDLNRVTRLTPDDTIRTAILKISDGDTFALRALARVHCSVGDAGMFPVVLGLDSLGVYGSDVDKAYLNARENPFMFKSNLESVFNGTIAKNDFIGGN